MRGRSVPRSEEGGSLAAFIDDAVFDHDLDAGERRDVEERIPAHDDAVGELPGLDRAEVLALAEDVVVDPRGGLDRAKRRHARVDVRLDLAPERFGMKVHR